MTPAIYDVRRRLRINRELAEWGDLRKIGPRGRVGKGNKDRTRNPVAHAKIAIRVPLGRCIRATLFIN